MLRTQRWPQLLAFMLALTCSASLVLHGSQRLQADHLDLAGPSGRSAIRDTLPAREDNSQTYADKCTLG